MTFLDPAAVSFRKGFSYRKGFSGFSARPRPSGRANRVTAALLIASGVLIALIALLSMATYASADYDVVSRTLVAQGDALVTVYEGRY